MSADTPRLPHGAGGTGGDLGYATFRVSPRAPRVAIIVQDGEHWQWWARLALYTATHLWGGAGFVLIPHTRGQVHPRLLQAVDVYDPDYVVVHQPTYAEAAAVDPNVFDVMASAFPDDEQGRASLLQSLRDHPADLPGGQEARERVLQACTAYRRWEEGHGWEEQHQLLSVDPSVAPFTRLEQLNVEPETAWAVPGRWSGEVALALAARCGIADKPEAAATSSTTATPATTSSTSSTSATLAAPMTSHPGNLSPTTTEQALTWLLGAEGELQHAPAELLQALAPERPGALQTALESGAVGLVQVTAGRGARTKLVVAGDSADDFALAMVWDRTYGGGYWLPRAWWPTGTTAEAQTAQRALNQTVSTQTFSDLSVVLTSTSVDSTDLTDLLQQLRTSEVQNLEPSATERGRRQRKHKVRAQRDPWPAQGKQHWAIGQQFDHTFALPVHRLEAGGTMMAAPAPPVTVTEPTLAARASLGWEGLAYEVDLQALPSTMPTGRSLPGNALYAPGANQSETWVRSGRSGLSYHAQRYDLVLAGSSPQARLARPQLQEPSLLEWAKAVAAPTGYTYALSDAGHRVQILARLAGSRDDITTLLAGTLYPALRAFLPIGKTTTASYPNQQGVVLNHEGYLTFDGISHYLPTVDAEDIREDVDTLLIRRLMRRGLILGCAECQRPAFHTLDTMGQHFTCPRCGHENDLTQPRWRDPVSEPTWYYDLHAAARELLDQNGDVPLLTARHLRRGARSYVDVAEIELVQLAGSKKIAECDLLAHVDNELVVAEAKNNGSLGTNKQMVDAAAAKRVLLARHARADQIVLATTASAWDARSITAMVSAIKQATTGQQWWNAMQPRLRLLTGLGHRHVSDDEVNTASGRSLPWQPTHGRSRRGR